MKYIDSHCHPQFTHFESDRDEVIARAREVGVGMICVGTDAEMSRRAIELAQQHPGLMWCSVGLHPNDNLDEQYDQTVYEQLAKDPSVVAIGEVGLDFYRTPDPEKQDIQRKRFEQQLHLAFELHKPLIIHCRNAHHEMAEMLNHWRYKRRVSGVIHSFTGTWEDAQKYLGLGFYIGLNGIVTFTEQYDETVRNLPLDRLLLETDAPFLTPEPHRGRRNEPSYMRLIAQEIAVKRGQSSDEIAQATAENAKKLFGI